MMTQSEFADLLRDNGLTVEMVKGVPVVVSPDQEHFRLAARLAEISGYNSRWDWRRGGVAGANTTKGNSIVR